jgi:hypothetical protein
MPVSGIRYQRGLQFFGTGARAATVAYAAFRRSRTHPDATVGDRARLVQDRLLLVQHCGRAYGDSQDKSPAVRHLPEFDCNLFIFDYLQNARDVRLAPRIKLHRPDPQSLAQRQKMEFSYTLTASRHCNIACMPRVLDSRHYNE